MVRKVCIVAPSLQMGGIERSLSIVANYLSSAKVEVHFVTLFPFEDFFELNDDVFIYKPNLVFRKKADSKIKNVLYYVQMLFPFRGIIVSKIKLINPDVVVSYGDWFPHLIMLGLKNRFPVIYSNRSNPQIRYPVMIEFIRWLAYRLTPPAGIIAQTSYAKSRKQRLLGQSIPVAVIPNPVAIKDSLMFEKKDWIVSVGRLHREKGFLRLIEAYSSIKNKDWKLVLVGEGIHRKDILDFVKFKGIEDNVIFMGKVKDVASVLLQSKIFVLASHNEGFPNALLEACSLGLPSISFDIVAGPSDIIENEKNGILLADGDINGLANSIDRLIEDEVLRNRLGKNAKHSSKRYDVNIIGMDIHSFLNKTISEWGKCR